MRKVTLSESALAHAWANFKRFHHTIRFIWLVQVLMMGVGAWIGTLLLSDTASAWQKGLYPAVGGVLGPLSAATTIFLGHLISAPYSQRNQLRFVRTNIESHDTLDQSIADMRNIVTGPGSHAHDVATILRALASDLALGIKYERISELLQSYYGGSWQQWTREVIAQLTIFNAIGSRVVEPRNPYGGTDTIIASDPRFLPYDEYYLTEQGKELARRLAR